MYGLMVMALAATDQGVPLDAAVMTSSGDPVKLAAQWGRPVVLFYEDRYSTKLNQALKDELFKRGADAGLLEKVQVVAVANLEGLDWFPARGFALAAVRESEKQAGVPVFVDWTGVLSKAPWRLPPKTSSVVVLDSAGKVTWQSSGALKPAEREAVFKELLRLISRDQG
jgi:hypothetical protein